MSVLHFTFKSPIKDVTCTFYSFKCYQYLLKVLVVDNKIVYYVSIDGKTIKQMLGSSIRELRIDKGITQEKLAELLELGVNTTNRIETGTSFITSETFAKLCNIFDVHPSVLLSAKPNHILKEHSDYIKAINSSLQRCSLEKIKICLRYY